MGGIGWAAPPSASNFVDDGADLQPYSMRHIWMRLPRDHFDDRFLPHSPTFNLAYDGKNACLIEAVQSAGNYLRRVSIK
eukprot:scaffold348628_cov18-Prasinocladus_malaysianus.AAC.1